MIVLTANCMRSETQGDMWPSDYIFTDCVTCACTLTATRSLSDLGKDGVTTAPPYRGNEVVPPSHHMIPYSSVGACGPPSRRVNFFLAHHQVPHSTDLPSAVALSGNRAKRGTLMRKHEGSKRLARKLSRERVARALEHPDVLAILLAHEVAAAEHKRARRRRRRQSSRICKAGRARRATSKLRCAAMKTAIRRRGRICTSRPPATGHPCFQYR